MPPGAVLIYTFLCLLGSSFLSAYETFTRSGTKFEHLALHPDPQTGTVYIGATNYLFQLSSDLQLRTEESTGPVEDSKDCLPPIAFTHCPQARLANNYNKLLLVNPYKGELITCGSVHQGICEKRSLDSIKNVLFKTDRPVDTQYVAANDPNVTTVGLVALSKEQLPVLFVGRGYTSSHPPISTRNLVSPLIFSYEETAKLAVAGRLSEYDHHFVKSFSHHSSVYFLFYRRDLKSQSREYKTYISRICLYDTSYYSYVEVPLVCRTAGKNYNLLQAVHVGRPAEGLGAGRLRTQGDVLVGVFSMGLASSGKPGEDSAMCMYVDTQYVAANDPNVTTVGLVALSKEQLPVLFVGRGYTSSHPPISTRNLVSPLIFSYEETAKLAVAGRLSEYDHHFVKSFSHHSSVYFLFYRRDLKSQSREYKTYISRICLYDTSYYSYVEVPLVCRTAGKNYNLLQAVHVGRPAEGLGAGRLRTQGDVLVGVFSMGLASSGKPGEDSAMCMYTLEEIDRRINATRDLCYMRDGRAEGGEAAYIEYDVKSLCANLPSNTLDAYPCGSAHPPSPMASRVPVEATPLLDSPNTRLTAVAVSVMEGHTIVFLGDSKGNLHKVFLGPSGEAEKYATIMIQSNAAIGGDLLLDQSQEYLYIMTQSMVVKRPVAECSKHLDCQSCLSANDPYCGWCVLEGMCGRRSDCLRSSLAGQWMWSYDQHQQCLRVQSLTPSNISREEKRTIFLSIPELPALIEEESYSCFFEDYESPAVLTETGVTCSSPDANKVPPIRQGEDYVTVRLSLRFLNITVSSTEFTFYDCSAVKQLSRSMP
ncbi:UNVERIFIED_CONTAM: hypothetical protein FKN15_021058 [Acipenser sinensis]